MTDSGKSIARNYLNALERCGYLKGIYPINKPKSWVLLKDTGGITANFRGIGIFDKNLEKLSHLSKALRAKINRLKIKPTPTYNTTTIKRFMSDLNGC